MARKLGYGVGNTSGARDFTSRVPPAPARTRQLGYGVGNTNGVRDFTGKAAAAGATIIAQARSHHRFMFGRIHGRMN